MNYKSLVNLRISAIIGFLALIAYLADRQVVARQLGAGDSVLRLGAGNP